MKLAFSLLAAASTLASAVRLALKIRSLELYAEHRCCAMANDKLREGNLGPQATLIQFLNLFGWSLA